MGLKDRFNDFRIKVWCFGVKGSGIPGLVSCSSEATSFGHLGPLWWPAAEFLREVILCGIMKVSRVGPSCFCCCCCCYCCCCLLLRNPTFSIRLLKIAGQVSGSWCIQQISQLWLADRHARTHTHTNTNAHLVFQAFRPKALRGLGLGLAIEYCDTTFALCFIPKLCMYGRPRALNLQQWLHIQ